MSFTRENEKAVLTDIISDLNELSPYLRYAVDGAAARPNDFDWIDETDFSHPDCPSQRRLLGELSKSEFGANPKACSAALLLRYGWSAGLLIGAWMARGAVLVGTQKSLGFAQSQSVLSAVSIEGCGEILLPSAGPVSFRRSCLIKELTRYARAVVEAHHHWSGYSRKALWSMVTSSWAAQVTAFAEKLGRPDSGISEATELLSLDSDTAASQPELYIVRAEGRQGICQRRTLCCLWYKSPQGQFCDSCPILTEPIRLARNHDWVAQYGNDETCRENAG